VPVTSFIAYNNNSSGSGGGGGDNDNNSDKHIINPQSSLSSSYKDLTWPKL